jgi:hypothetical protein
MRSYMMNHRTAGVIIQTLDQPKRTMFRGAQKTENVRGVEPVREALELIKQVLREEQDPQRRLSAARAGLYLNDLILK